MSYETIVYGVADRIATIMLNRPDRMNAVIEQMYHELQRALAAAAADSEVRCLVLTGSVLRRQGVEKQAFCAGADLREHAADSRSSAEKRAYIELAHETIRHILELPKPVVAAVNGPARGAGAELAVGCDLVVMAEEASIGFPEIGLATFVGGAVTHLLPRLVGLARARELLYTGRVLDGGEAYRLGLVTRCVPLARLQEETRELCRTLASAAPRSLALAKRYLQRCPAQDLETALQLETDAILSCMETEDWHEGVRAFAEKRAPVYKGS